jgi:hypothetical protein
MSTAAFAKVQSKLVSFGQDFMVGGTPIKAGTYRVSYDDKTNEFTVSDKKSKTVLAKVSGRTEKRKSSTFGFDIKMDTENGSQVLTSIAFPGDSNVIQLAPGDSAGPVNTAQ